MVNHLGSPISDALHCLRLRFRPKQSLVEGPSVKYAGSIYFEATHRPLSSSFLGLPYRIL